MDIKIIATQYFYEDKSYKEIGKFFGVSKQAIHSFVNRNSGKFKLLSSALIPAIDDAHFTPNKKIRLKRKILGISQQELADRLGTTKQYVCGIEKYGKGLTGKYAKEISKILNV